MNVTRRGNPVLLAALALVLVAAPASAEEDGDPLPQASISAGPDDVTNLRKASFEFSADQEGASFLCSLDEGAPEPCESPLALSALPDGSHVMEVRAVGPSGAEGPAAPAWSWTVDKTAPTGVTLGGPVFDKTFSLAASFPLEWGAADAGPGPLLYRLAVERTKPSGQLARYEIVLDETTDTSTIFDADPGFTYCFAITAKDRAGNSTVSPRRCVSRPLDDTKLVAASEEWRRVSANAAYLRTQTRTSEPGVSLKRYRVGASSLALVATTCPRCGKIEVLIDDRVLRRIDLSSSSIRHGRIISVARFDGPESGRLTIRTISNGKPVILEGVGFGNLSRSEVLLSHSSVGLRRAARVDVERGLVDPRILEALLHLSETFDFTPVGPFVSGHPTLISGTDRISSHKYGRAVDLYSVGGEPVTPHNAGAKSAARAILELAPLLRPERMGCPWSLESANVIVFINGHADHVHLSYAPPPLAG